MAIDNPPTPFMLPHYRLSPVLELSVLKPFEAAQAGVLCASMDPWSRYPTTAAELTQFFAQVETGVQRFAIRVNGIFEGVIVLRANWFAGPYIQTMALARNAQGAGTGSTILGFVEAEARAARNRNLWVAASDFNSGALRLYERHGYKRVAEIDGLLRNGRTEVLLRKTLFATAGPGSNPIL